MCKSGAGYVCGQSDSGEVCGRSDGWVEGDQGLALNPLLFAMVMDR